MRRILITGIIVVLLISLSGCQAGLLNFHDAGIPFKRALILLSIITQTPQGPPYQPLVPPAENCGATYFVDYDSGDDANTGTSSAQAWKHCPGDPNAAGIPAQTTLQPGDAVSFRGGVHYRGSITLKSSGSETDPIYFKGGCWGASKAVLDGSETLSGWQHCASAEECGNNPNWNYIYYTYIPAAINVTPFTANFHELDEFLWIAQEPDQPDPFFWDKQDNFYKLPIGAMTTTSLTDPINLNQPDPNHWTNSSVALWVYPNIVVVRDILSYDPADNRITYADVGAAGVYTDRETYYSIFNSLHALDQVGEYYINPVPEADGTHKAYLWPRDPAHLGNGIGISTKNFGINIANSSFNVIEGFQIQKFSGNDLTDGIGIGTVTVAYMQKRNITIRNNVIRHNRHGTLSGYGGIYLGSCDYSLVENNTLEENVRHRGIFIASSWNCVVRDNTVRRAGSTSIGFYTDGNCQIVGNTVIDSNGSHANGITLYLGCYNVLVAWNRVYDSPSPITLQNSGNIWFYRNLVDANGYSAAVNEWGHGGNASAFGNIVFVNNTLVRSNSHSSLNIGDWYQNRYVSRNNILDGAGGNPAEPVDRDYNLYTGLCWNQDPRYGWYPAAHEAVETDMGMIFADPAGGDFHLTSDGPAIDTGTDAASFLPMNIFWDVDFYRDIDGNPVAQNNRDLGAYAR